MLLAGMTMIGLSGCVTDAQQIAEDQEKCFDYGFTPGTSAFAKCRMTLDQRRGDDLRDYMKEYDQKRNQELRDYQRAQRRQQN